MDARTGEAMQAIALREAREALARQRAGQRLEKAQAAPLFGSAIAINHGARDLMDLINAARDPITASHFHVDDQVYAARARDFFFDQKQMRSPPPPRRQVPGQKRRGGTLRGWIRSLLTMKSACLPRQRS